MKAMFFTGKTCVFSTSIFLAFFSRIFYLFSWEFGELAAMLSRLATSFGAADRAMLLN